MQDRLNSLINHRCNIKHFLNRCEELRCRHLGFSQLCTWPRLRQNVSWRRPTRRCARCSNYTSFFMDRYFRLDTLTNTHTQEQRLRQEFRSTRHQTMCPAFWIWRKGIGILVLYFKCWHFVLLLDFMSAFSMVFAGATMITRNTCETLLTFSVLCFVAYFLTKFLLCFFRTSALLEHHHQQSDNSMTTSTQLDGMASPGYFSFRMDKPASFEDKRWQSRNWTCIVSLTSLYFSRLTTYDS